MPSAALGPFFSLRNKMFIAFFLLSAFIIVAITYTLFNHMRTNHLDTLKRDLRVITGMAALKMQEAVIEKGTRTDDSSHNELHNQLTQIKEYGLNLDKIFIYKLTGKLDSPIEVIDDLEANHVDSHVGETYQLPTGVTLANLLAGPVVTGTVSRSTSETITAFAPIRNHQGIPVAILGIIVDSAQVTDDLNHFLVELLSIGIAATLIVAAITWVLASNFSRRLSRLEGALNRIMTGQLDISLAVDGRDEVAALAARINQVADSIHSEREKLLLDTIESLVAELEAKDPYTFGHSSQVSSLTVAMSHQLNVKEADIFQFRIAALLHDIGKIGVPDQILNKPGFLDIDERKSIEQHPVIGAKILAGIPALSQVTEIVRHHHARWDGSGYPEPLAGNEIPLGARIIAVADSFQAITSDRTYRAGMPTTVALTELKRCAGSQFDPDVVAAFAAISETLAHQSVLSHPLGKIN